MTTFEVPQSGTNRVAEYFAKPGETGTAAQGQRADLILLELNPLNDVANVAWRAGAVVNGRWIPASEIKAKLKELEAAAGGM